MSELYFDSNVYARIDAEGSTPEVRDWISRNHFRLRVSENIMSEALRIPEPNVRKLRFAVITQLANVFPQPGAFLTMKELIQAIGRRRPQWLRRDPDTQYVSRFLNLDRNTWRRLQADPAYFPPGIAHSLNVLHLSAGKVRDGQRRTKDRLRGTKATMAAALPAEGAEASWRTAAAFQLISSLFPEEQTKRWSGLTFAYLDPSRITPDELASFFQKEVRPDELPRTRLMGVADYLQRRYELTSGNWTDQGHAVELLEVDTFVTRDRTFAKVLEDLATYLNVRATVLFLNSRDSVLSQLEIRINDLH